jgi:virulence-associated protein VagC
MTGQARSLGYATVLLLGMGGIACSGGGTAPIGTDFSGVYTVSVKAHQAVCHPNALPSPALSDTTRYVRLPSDFELTSAKVVVAQMGSQISISPVDSLGQPQSILSLVGTIDQTNNESLTMRTAPSHIEGLREGGHTFAVTESTQAITKFQPLIGTPDGGTVGAAEQTVSTDSFVFRDGLDGPVFATCVAVDTTSGARGSQ